MRDKEISMKMIIEDKKRKKKIFLFLFILKFLFEKDTL